MGPGRTHYGVDTALPPVTSKERVGRSKRSRGGSLVEVRRLEGFASLGEGGVLALVGPQEGHVRVRCAGGSQGGVVALPAQGHGGARTAQAAPVPEKSTVKVYIQPPLGR